MVHLNWGSVAFTRRLVWEVRPQERPRCPVVGILSGSRGREVERGCVRPVGHPGAHRVSGISWGPVAWITPDGPDPVIEAQRTLRSAEMAVRRTRGAKG